MAVENADYKHELTNIELDEISLVDRAANNMKFAVIKRKQEDPNMADKNNKAEIVEKQEERVDEIVDTEKSTEEKPKAKVEEVVEKAEEKVTEKEEAKAEIDVEKKNEDKESEMINMFIALFEKAKAVTPKREAAIRAIAEQAASLLGEIETPKIEEEIIEEPVVEKQEDSEEESEISKALDAVTKNINDKFEQIIKSNDELNKRVEKLENIRMPSNKLDTETDNNIKKQNESKWSGLPLSVGR